MPKQAAARSSRTITRHKRGQEELLEKLHTLANSTPDFIVFKDGEGRWLEANDAAIEIFDMKGVEYRGRTDLDLAEIAPLHKESLTVCDQTDQLTWAHRGSLHFDEHVRKDGYTLVFDTIKTPIFNPDGSRKGMVTLGRDITERKKAEEGLRQSIAKLKNTIEGVIEIIIMITELRDPYTSGHQRRVAKLASRIAEEMKLPSEKVDGILFASSIHDLGKIYVPSEILGKPGPISDTEFSFFKTHPRVGYDLLKVLDFPWPIGNIILQHHERMNGSGYPSGLSGDKILLEARILAVADVVESMSSHRPYRDSLGIDKALEEIALNRGKLYDPDVVDACIALFKTKKFSLDNPAPK